MREVSVIKEIYVREKTELQTVYRYDEYMYLM
jgi:hypothetical protein